MGFCFFTLTHVFADENIYSADSYNKNLSQTSNIPSSDFDSDYWHYQKNDTKRYLLTVGGITVAFMLTGVGILYLLPSSITNWDTGGSAISNLGSKWHTNVMNSPVYDRDAWFLNYITHPYWGAIYYMQGRNGGLGPLGSFMVSAFASTFLWEFGVEAFAEKPSIQDLFLTPIMGSFLGEGFWQASQSIKQNNEEVFGSKALGWTLLTIMDPGFLLIEKTGLRNIVRRQSTHQNYTSYGVSNNTMILRMKFDLN
ncbi:MAG: DUF3943 domain-containing protein [Alphaproteobacteria bacterium]|nr:DUF3943 domain-containing protein [Alphaproteobacteria bacterium]